MDQNQQEFLVEIEELVERIFANLDELRLKTADGPARRELIDKIFRQVHSVKGSAASGGLEAVSKTAHEFENLLDAVRGRRVALDDLVLDVSERATEALADSLRLTAAGAAQPSRSPLFSQLRAVAANNTIARDLDEVLTSIPSEIWEGLGEPEKQRLVDIVEEGCPLFVVSASFDIASFTEEFSGLKERLAQLGEVVSTSPRVDEERADRVNFRVLYGSRRAAVALRAAFDDFAFVTFTEVAQGKVVPSSSNAEPGSTANKSTSVSSLSNFVRTDLEKLNQLISSTHELFRATSSALDLALSEEQLSQEVRQQLGGLTQKIKNSFLNVEDELINLRLVSLGPILQRAVRAGRAAARVAVKEVDFEIVGGELLFDKLFVDAIADPLIHLMRNAIDHGIEPATERAAAGKRPRGLVRIEALNDGVQSRVSVIDDGRGIDQSLISETARRLGILAGNAQCDFDRSMRLIFRPGFSTLKSATDTSGRGVGLDVVETAVEQVGGEVRVSSSSQGSTFEIRLPVTSGLLAATVVVSDGVRYCIPTSQIVSVSESDPNGSESIPGLGSQPVSLLALLGRGADKASNSKGFVINCELSEPIQGSTRKRFSILVDEVLGEEDVLVRSLGRHAGRWYGIGGATEFRDGTVALVLDLSRLLL